MVENTKYIATIEKNGVGLFGKIIHIGMLYTDVNEIVKEYARINDEAIDDMSGFIVIKAVDFYDVKGRCKINFFEKKVSSIVFSPERKYYDVCDVNGKILCLDDIIEKMSGACIETLNEKLGEPKKEFFWLAYELQDGKKIRVKASPEDACVEVQMR